MTYSLPNSDPKQTSTDGFRERAVKAELDIPDVLSL